MIISLVQLFGVTLHRSAPLFLVYCRGVNDQLKRKKLSTPLGNIDIKIDGLSVPYDYGEMCRIFGYDLRYFIALEYIPDGKAHVISCTLERGHFFRSGPDSGERFACIRLEDKGVEVSIALEGETDYIDGERYSQYDYDDIFLDNGLSFGIFPDN